MIIDDMLFIFSKQSNHLACRECIKSGMNPPVNEHARRTEDYLVPSTSSLLKRIRMPETRQDYASYIEICWMGDLTARPLSTTEMVLVTSGNA